jgi:quercetin dioxygenase-like cupin family protein
VAVAGERLHNPMTGEQLVFRRVAADTGGELLEFDWCFPPRGSVPAHVHRCQEERFEILSGRAWFRVAGRQLRAGAGKRVAVPPRTVHKWGNAGTDELWARIQFRPALRTEQLFQALFALAHDGRVDRKGRPRALQIAVLLNEFRDELQMPWVPAPLQGRLLKLLTAFGRRGEGTSAGAPSD